MPIHPAIVHFPIALSLILVIFEFRKDIPSSLKTLILIIFAITLSTAFFTGLSDSSLYINVSDKTQNVLSSHYNISRIVFFIGLLLLALDTLIGKFPAHRNLLLTLYRVLLSVVVILMIITGVKGGQLVYQEGLGVKRQEIHSSE